MKMTFRWYGESDCIPLDYIKQIPGMSGVVTAVYDVPVGEVWNTDKLFRLKELCDKAMLETMGNPEKKYGFLLESKTIVPEDYKIFDKNKGLNKVIDKFKDNLKKFLKWMCHKFSYPCEDDLIRDFNKETYSNINFEKQFNTIHFQKEDNEIDFEI